MDNKIQIDDVLIRRATADDAPEIANVHLNSWREAYRGLLPQGYLDELPLTFKERMNTWKRISTQENKALYVAEASSGIVGFAGFRHGQEPSLKEFGELGAIYLLQKYKGRGVGDGLLRMGMQQLINWNYSKAYCWVLKGNPTIKFYERTGASFNGMQKTDEIGGLQVQELVYEWKNLDSFRNTGNN